MNYNTAILVQKIPTCVSKEEISAFFSMYGKVIQVACVSNNSYKQYYNSTDSKSQSFIVWFDSSINRVDILSQLKGKEFDCPSLENKTKCPLHIKLLEDVQDETKLFIGMIPEKTTEKEILSYLQKYGVITEFVMIKKGDKQNKGYGFCHFSNRAQAIQAIKGMNGKTFLHGSSISLVVKFADTPSQRMNRLQCQKKYTKQTMSFNNKMSIHGNHDETSPISLLNQELLNSPSKYSKEAVISRNSKDSQNPEDFTLSQSYFSFSLHHNNFPSSFLLQPQLGNVLNDEILSLSNGNTTSKQSFIETNANNEDNPSITYDMEFLSDYPPLSFSLDNKLISNLDFSVSSFWIDFAPSYYFGEGTPYDILSTTVYTKNDIINSNIYQTNTGLFCNSCIHIFNFPNDLDISRVFTRCKEFGKISDIVILSRFPFTYGRIECSDYSTAKDLFLHLNSPSSLRWILN